MIDLVLQDADLAAEAVVVVTAETDIAGAAAEAAAAAEKDIDLGAQLPLHVVDHAPCRDPRPQSDRKSTGETRNRLRQSPCRLMTTNSVQLLLLSRNLPKIPLQMTLMKVRRVPVQC
jgi:hypothetical protein